MPQGANPIWYQFIPRSGPTVAGMNDSSPQGYGSGSSQGGNSGAVTVKSGDAGAASGGVTIGSGSANNANSGDIYIASGPTTGTGASGAVGMESGESDGDTGVAFFGTSTPSVEGNSGDVVFYTGNAAGTNKNAGSIKHFLGAGSGGGLQGQFSVEGLPTSDPLVAGAFWIDVAGGRVLKVSNG